MSENDRREVDGKVIGTCAICGKEDQELFEILVDYEEYTDWVCIECKELSEIEREEYIEGDPEVDEG